MNFQPIQILLVEDSVADVRLTREALADGKVANDLHVVADGEAALAFLRREAGYEGVPAPDLILLDLNLPRLPGHEVLAALKEDLALRSIPVAVLTTSEAEADVIRSYDLGASCYLTKPVDFNEFIKVVAAIEDFWLTVVRLPHRVPAR
jgi:two-component system, chemotaxis family, response regulator Rcp1